MWPFDRFLKAPSNSSSNNSLDDRVGSFAIPTYQEGKLLYHPQDFQAQIDNNIKWVYRCAQIIADAANVVPFRLFTMKNSGNQVRVFPHKSVAKEKTEWLEAHNPAINRVMKQAGELVEVTAHPYYDLITSVNPHMNESDIKKLKWVSDRLTGNAYWYKVKNGAGRPVRLWPLPTPNMFIIPSKDDFISGYGLKVPGKAQPVMFDESEIIHFKDPSPDNMFYGRSPMAAMVDSVTLQQYMDKFDRDLFFNKAIPEVVLTTDDKVLVQSTVDRAKKTWKETFNFLAGRTGDIAILGGGLTPHQLTMSPQDLNYHQGQLRVRDEILGIYGVPLTKVDPSQIKANTDASDRQFLKDTVYPLLIRDQEKINEKLLPDFDARLVGAYDNPVPDDREFQLTQDVEHIKSGLRKRNELRERDGLEPYPPEEGDIVPNFPGGGFSDTETDDTNEAKFIDDIAKQVVKGMYGKLST